MLAVAAVVVALDQASKGIIRGELAAGEHRDLILGFDLSRITNDGIAFGAFDGAGEGLVLAFTALALALVLGWFYAAGERPGMWLGVGLLVGGATGNLIDRVRWDGVTDFIDPPAWPAFNLADVAITVGVVVLALSALAPSAEDADPG
jgi:signal peptidase II